MSARYLNNIPVDVMRGLGVDSVIVVDVEDKDASVWRNLSAYDGGISGWRLLWDRWCPIPSLRSSCNPSNVLLQFFYLQPQGMSQHRLLSWNKLRACQKQGLQVRLLCSKV